MIKLSDMLAASGGRLAGAPDANTFADFCFDSRRVNPGELFVALKTDRGDGHLYMADAVAGGATGLLCQQPPAFESSGITVIITPSVEDALMRWAQIVLRALGTTVIGVTGSAGKSTTKEAIAQVLGTRYSVYKNPASFNGRFGLPLALGRLTAAHQIAVLEYGIDQFGEMADMVAMTHPAVGVVTGISHAHTDRLGSLENIAAEKAILLRDLPPDGLAVLNHDDSLVRAMASRTGAPVRTVGLAHDAQSGGADLAALNIRASRDQTAFDLRHGASRITGQWTPLLGAHQLVSVLAALAVGQHFDVPLEEGLQILRALEPLPGRMRPLAGPKGSLLIDDSYNANPEGMLAALDWLGAVEPRAGRRIFVMGDMHGLGSYAPAAHVQVGQQALGAVDHLVTQGDLAAEAGRAALDQAGDRARVHITFSAEDAARAAAANLGADDIVLVKGSPGARMERVVRRLLASPRDVRLLARQERAYDDVWMTRPARPTWVRIDMEAIAYNVRRLKEMVGPGVALMAVVKANAYGHGAIPVSVTALNNGASYLGVASINEAIDLREAGIDAPILILGYTPPWAAPQVIRYDVTVNLYDPDVAQAFDRIAREMNAAVRAHVKVDSGMGRLGLLPHEAEAFVRRVSALENVVLEGIYTHFSVADEDRDYTRAQIATFQQVLDPLLAAGCQFDYVHAANSAAALHVPESRFNMVRVGLAMHGLNPGPAAPVPPDFKPAMAWKTTIAQVKRLPPGSFVGYGNTYRTQGEQTIAIIPVGYADGFRRAPYHWQHVLVHGEFAPLVGRVSMDQSAIDVTHIPQVRVGDEVVLIGTQGERRITADDAAAFLHTINYEVVSTILARVPRVT